MVTLLHLTCLVTADSCRTTLRCEAVQLVAHLVKWGAHLTVRTAPRLPLKRTLLQGKSSLEAVQLVADLP